MLEQPLNYFSVDNARSRKEKDGHVAGTALHSALTWISTFAECNIQPEVALDAWKAAHIGYAFSRPRLAAEGITESPATPEKLDEV